MIQRRKTHKTARSKSASIDLVRYGLIAASVWLAWEIVKVPLIERAPPAIALGVAPQSPIALSRAAEAEWVAKRYENADELADIALSRAPFNVTALRVKGLIQARSDAALADQTLTLAGNWSLRDDPTHSWLVEHRLRTGQVQSAFAHADTLARRREDLYPAIFPLFTTAGALNSRALGILAELLAKRPLWRGAYLANLREDPEQTQFLANLIITMQQTEAPLTNAELRDIFLTWSAAGQYPALAVVRERLNRPSEDTVVNGEFSSPAEDELLPFGWRLGVASGVSANIVEDDLRKGNQALRVEYDGFGSANALEQLLLLKPGRHLLRVNQRTETLAEGLRFDWQVRCATNAKDLLSRGQGEITSDWRRLDIRFEVPEGCNAQWLLLQPRVGDRRTQVTSWFDGVQVLQE